MTHILTRSMVQWHFEDENNSSTIGGTTHTGSVYLIELMPSTSEQFEFMGMSFTIRRGSAIINGELYTDATYVGFCKDYGCFLALDSDKEMVRRSSSIAQLHLAE
jgi:hypothetical protein